MSKDDTSNFKNNQVKLGCDSIERTLLYLLKNTLILENPFRVKLSYNAPFNKSNKNILDFEDVRDDLPFLKLYNRAAMIRKHLSNKGTRVFDLVCELLLFEKGVNAVSLSDKVRVLYNQCATNKDAKLGMTSFKEGIKELVKHNIIFHRYDLGRRWFEVNCNLVHNGKRKDIKSNFNVIDLATEREKREEKAV